MYCLWLWPDLNTQVDHSFSLVADSLLSHISRQVIWIHKLHSLCWHYVWCNLVHVPPKGRKYLRVLHKRSTTVILWCIEDRLRHKLAFMRKVLARHLGGVNIVSCLDPFWKNREGVWAYGISVNTGSTAWGCINCTRHVVGQHLYCTIKTF